MGDFCCYLKIFDITLKDLVRLYSEEDVRSGFFQALDGLAVASSLQRAAVHCQNHIS